MREHVHGCAHVGGTVPSDASKRSANARTCPADRWPSAASLPADASPPPSPAPEASSLSPLLSRLRPPRPRRPSSLSLPASPSALVAAAAAAAVAAVAAVAAAAVVTAASAATAASAVAAVAAAAASAAAAATTAATVATAAVAEAGRRVAARPPRRHCVHRRRLGGCVRGRWHGVAARAAPLLGGRRHGSRAAAACHLPPAAPSCAGDAVCVVAQPGQWRPRRGWRPPAVRRARPRPPPPTRARGRQRDRCGSGGPPEAPDHSAPSVTRPTARGDTERAAAGFWGRTRVRPRRGAAGGGRGGVWRRRRWVRRDRQQLAWACMQPCFASPPPAWGHPAGGVGAWACRGAGLGGGGGRGAMPPRSLRWTKRCAARLRPGPPHPPVWTPPCVGSRVSSADGAASRGSGGHAAAPAAPRSRGGRGTSAPAAAAAHWVRVGERLPPPPVAAAARQPLPAAAAAAPRRAGGVNSTPCGGRGRPCHAGTAAPGVRGGRRRGRRVLRPGGGDTGISCVATVCVSVAREARPGV